MITKFPRELNSHKNNWNFGDTLYMKYFDENHKNFNIIICHSLCFKKIT